jgi:hypothetical protein
MYRDGGRGGRARGRDDIVLGYLRTVGERVGFMSRYYYIDSRQNKHIGR